VKRAAILLMSAGCIDETVLEPVANKLDGIYEIASLTQNTSSCEPGAEVPRTHTHALAFLDPSSRELARDSVGGDFFIVSCASQAECRDRHSQVLLAGRCCGQAPIQFLFQGAELGDDAPDTIIEARLQEPLFVDNTCRAGRIDTLIARDGGAFHVSQKTSVVKTYPADGGDCDLDTAIDLARDAPCEQLELLDANVVEELDD